MSIQELYENFKENQSGIDVVLVLIIALTGVGGFMLGTLSTKAEQVHSENMYVSSSEQRVVETENKPAVVLPQQNQVIQNNTQEQASGYVASKNGTKYHLPWCGSAKQIKEENKVWFATKEEAEKDGYTPASNCKGI